MVSEELFVYDFSSSLPPFSNLYSNNFYSTSNLASSENMKVIKLEDDENALLNLTF